MKPADRYSDDELEAALLHKFVMKGSWHAYHIYESDVPKGFPPAQRKGIMNALKILVRRGLIITFPHGKEHAYVLNKERTADILERVKKYYPEYGDQY